MSDLTPNDVRRWDSAAVRKVFEVANSRAVTLYQLGADLEQVDARLRTWEGEAGDAFRADIGKTRADIELDGHESQSVAAPTQLQWDTANSGSKWGPSTSLERHHWVGDATIPAVRPNMPSWQWELENINPFEGEPFVSHTTKLADPFAGGIPAVATGR